MAKFRSWPKVLRYIQMGNRKNSKINFSVVEADIFGNLGSKMFIISSESSRRNCDSIIVSLIVWVLKAFHRNYALGITIWALWSASGSKVLVHFPLSPFPQRIVMKKLFIPLTQILSWYSHDLRLPQLGVPMKDMCWMARPLSFMFLENPTRHVSRMKSFQLM